MTEWNNIIPQSENQEDSWYVHHSQENGWFMTLLYPHYFLEWGALFCKIISEGPTVLRSEEPAPRTCDRALASEEPLTILFERVLNRTTHSITISRAIHRLTLG